MCRPPREFRAESFELEGRLLLAIAHASTPVRSKYVQFGQVGFDDPTNPGSTTPSQVVGQQDGEAFVMLSRSGEIGPGRVQVRVTTDASSPAVGVNVGAVDQTVTFAKEQTEAAVKVPILSGAPNPGEVDVDLNITPVSPNVTTSGPLELRILASDATLPPKIVSSQGTRHGIVLTFSKPMNPVGASNVKNYAVSASTTSSNTDWFLVPIDILTFPLHMDSSISTSYSDHKQTVPLRAAEYDPATNSVTLVPKRRLTYSAIITVTEGQPAKTSVRPGNPSSLGPGLTDLDGHPINLGTSPGRFYVYVANGLQPAT